MLTNKHVVAALIIAPILAVLAYLAVDVSLSEPGAAPQSGQSYPLVSGAKCRYQSGQCVMKNGNFKIVLVADRVDPDTLQLKLRSDFPLEGARVALAFEDGTENPPTEMMATGDDRRQWQVQLLERDVRAEILRVVVASGDSYYFGSTGLVFSDYQTGYHKDFRAQNDD